MAGVIESSDHVQPDVAARFADHDLGEDEVRDVEGHIDTCEPCRELISALAKSRWSISASSGGDGHPPTVLPRGTVIGRFEIDRPLDAGGMGMVYVARDLRLERAVAIKAIRNTRAGSAVLLAEARTMARIAHPNVVAVHEAVEERGQVYVAMELVVGRSLRRWVDETKPSWRQVLDAFIAAGTGLIAVHAADIVHGDVKPANILVGDDGRVRIADFGLATTDCASGDPRGTPAYMAPEQRTAGARDALADQYAFCASLHEALFGALPDEPVLRRPRIPRSLRRAIARGLAVAPRDRHASMAHLVRALRSAAAQRTRWVALAATAIAVVGTGTYALGASRASADTCDADVSRLVSPWDASAKFAVERSFRTTKLSYVAGILERVEANLDRWTAELDGTRASLCTSVPAEQRPAVTACLEARIAEVRAVVGLFQDTVEPSTVLGAVAATEQLALPSRCRDLDGTPPPAQEPSAARRELSDLQARAFALMAAGKFREALPVNRRLVDEARLAGDPGIEAGARVSLARNLINTSAFGEAHEILVEAVRLAEVAHRDRTRVQALLNFVILEYRRGKFDQALAVYRLAIGAAQRVGDRYLETELLVTAGQTLSLLGKPGEARPMFERAVELRRALYGERSPRLAAALTALGNSYAIEGDLERAVPHHRRARDITEAALGAAHPDSATAHGNLGSDALYGLHVDEALREFASAARTFEAAHGDRHHDLAGALTELATAQLDAQRHAEALATAQRAERIWAALAPQHPSRARAWLALYRARRATGATADARELEEALGLAKGLPPFQRAEIQLELGRAVGGARGVALVEEAAAGFAVSRLPRTQRELAAAKAWLAERRR